MQRSWDRREKWKVRISQFTRVAGRVSKREKQAAVPLFNLLSSRLPLPLDPCPRECRVFLILYSWVSDVWCWASYYLVLGKDVFSEGINERACIALTCGSEIGEGRRMAGVKPWSASSLSREPEATVGE